MNTSHLQKLKPMNLPPLCDTPLVSVLVANYNYARFLPEALTSALNQAYSNLEIIVSDDGSTNTSCGLAERFAKQDARVRLIRQPNGGVASALNAAFMLSKGNLVAFLDADDIWMKDRVKQVVAKFHEQPQAGMVTHRLRVVDNTGRELDDFSRGRSYGAGWLAPLLLSAIDPGFPPSSALTIRREVAEKVFPLPIAFRKMADGVLRNRAATLAVVGTINKHLGRYRIHGANVTGYGELPLADAADQVILLKRLVESDIIEFAACVHGIDPALLKPLDHVRSLVFSRAILRNENVPRHDIPKYAFGLKRWIWTLVFELPAPARFRLYAWWCRCRLFRLRVRRASSAWRVSRWIRFRSQSC